MSIQMTVDKPEDTKKFGLVDGPKHLLRCKTCNSPLALIHVVRPDFCFRDGTQYFYNYKATCPYCGVGSESQKINGDVRIMAISKESETEDGAVKEQKVTEIADIQDIEEQELCLIKVNLPRKT